MKNRAYTYLAAFLISIGTGVYNYTQEDIILPDGNVIQTHDIAQNLHRTYGKRPTDSLFITIHHTAGSRDESIESIAKFHVEQRNFPEVAYHIAIDKDGNVRFLNWLDELTWHDAGSNTNSIGIVLIGNYEEYYPTNSMMQSLEIVTDWLCKNSGIKIRGIRAHKDTPNSATKCCGKNAYEEIKENDIFF